jgi:hypothetical protein
MSRGKIAFQVVLLFIACVVGYALVFRWVENRRVSKGPWVVTFADDAGHPMLEVNHAALKIEHIRVVFVDASPTTNATQTIEFSQAREVPFDLPFGQCIFQDALYLPGTVAMKAFGHEIQLIPRVLIINGKEQPWRSGETIEVHAARNAPPVK